ncbi:hypothetical protein ACFE04_013167 [Oxalis oulophora]
MNYVFKILFIFSLICFQIKVEATTGSVIFIDSSSSQRYLRAPSINHHTTEPQSMLLSEVGATMSVLLGFAPPSTLSASGSSKLNEILMPNPFDRPRAVFSLEVSGLDGNSLLTNGMSRKVVIDSNKSDIQLPGEEVSIISLDDQVVNFTNKEISDLASWLGGSYNTKAADLVLSFPLASGNHIDLYMSKDVDRKFVGNILSLVRNLRRAMKMHENLSRSVEGPAELLMGSFDGIKNWREQYGAESVQKVLELLITALSKEFHSLQAAYEGQIVGVIICNRNSQEESGKLLNVVLTSRPPARWLAEKTVSPTAAAIAEVVLVRLTLAWITGIILLISTLLGIYFLLSMPLTKDTLLYSNVKLD